MIIGNTYNADSEAGSCQNVAVMFHLVVTSMLVYNPALYKQQTIDTTIRMPHSQKN